MDNSHLQALLPIICVGVLILLGFAVFYIWFVWGNIFEKAGYSRVYCLFLLLPLGQLIATIIFAFSDWPILQASRYPYPPPVPPPYPPQPPLPPQ
jgi:hypothetical protein